MAIATLTIDINAKLATLQQDLGKVAQLGEQTAARMQRAFAAAGSVMSTLGVAVGAGGLAAIVKGAVDSAAALDDMAEVTGASVENLSKLQAVAKVSGVDMGNVESAMVRLTKALAGADDESKGAAKALAVLGLSMDDLRGMDSADALTAVARALAQYEDGAGKTAAAIAILGRNGAQALPYLKDLAEAGSLNATVTAQQAAEAEKLQKSWNRMTNDIAMLARSIVMDMVPALNQVASMANKAGVGVGGALGASIDRALVGGNIQTRIRELQAELDAREKTRATPGSITGGGLLGAMAGISDEALRRRIAGLKELASQEALLNSASYGNEGKRRLNPGQFAADGKEKRAAAGKAAGGAVDDYEARLNQLVAGAIGGSAVVKAREFAAVMERLDSLYFDSGIDAEVYASAVEKLAGVTDKAAKESDRLGQLLAATPTAKLEEARQDMELLAAALESGRISEEQYLEATIERLNLTAEKVAEVDDFAKQMGLTFSSAFEDAIIGGKGLSDVLKGLGQDIARIFLRQTITEPMGSAISGAIKSSGIGSGIGDWFGSLFGGGRASGGGIDASKWYVVGERGPEIFAPGVSGNILPNGGGALTVNLIEAPGKGGQVRQRAGSNGRVLDVTVESIKAAVAQDIMRGAGPVPAAMQAAYGLGRVGSA